jgi:hypothetical protein
MSGDAAESDARFVSAQMPRVWRVVETRVALRYPNGRVAERSLDRELNIGDSFELYGHRWVAEGWTSGSPKRSSAGRVVTRLVCVPTDREAPG